jgi:hypothetical protein
MQLEMWQSGYETEMKSRNIEQWSETREIQIVFWQSEIGGIVGWRSEECDMV